jgi:hypothetical protein
MKNASAFTLLLLVFATGRAVVPLNNFQRMLPSRICPFLSTAWNKTRSAGFLRQDTKDANHCLSHAVLRLM